MTARYLLVLACLGLTAIPSPAGEPFAQGKPLSYWLLLLREGELSVDPAGAWESEVGAGPFRTSQALKVLGTEASSAVPALLAWFREDNGSADAHRIKAQYLRSTLRDIGCVEPSLAPLRRGLAVFVDSRVDPEAVADRRRQEQQVKAAALLAEFRSSGQKINQFAALLQLSRIDPEQARVGLPFLKELLLGPVEAGSSRYDEILDPTPILQEMGPAAREAAALLEYRMRQEGRASLAVALAHIAPEKAAALLRREPAALRKEVAHLLSTSDNLRPAAADLLAELLEVKGVALDTASALVKLDPSKGKKTIPLFIESLNDLDPEIQLRAAAALLRLDTSRNKEVASVLRNIVKDYEGPSRDRARELLRLMGKEAIPALVDLLDDPRWAFDVLEELPRFGSDAKEAIPAFRKLLAHKDRGYSIRAAWAMARIDPDSLKPAVARLVEAMDDPRAVVRQLAILSLGKIAAQDETALTTLTNKLGSKADADDVTTAVHGLLALGKTAVKPLVDRLTDRDVQARCNAAWVLAEVGPPANAALPALRRLLADKELFVRIRAIYALARIDPKQDLEEIEKVLRAGMACGDRTGREAATALGRLARERNLMPAIVRALRAWPRERILAANAALSLCARGPKEGDSWPTLVAAINATLDPRLTDSEADQLHWQQARGRLLLRAITGVGPEATPAVLPFLKFDGLYDVEAALASLGAPDPKAIPELRSLLKDHWLRPRIIALLSRMESEVREVLPDLTTLDEFDALDSALTPHDGVLARVRAGVWPPNSFFKADTFAQPRARDATLVRKAGKDVIPELVKLLAHTDLEVREGAAYALGLAGAEATEAGPRLARMLGKDRPRYEATIRVALWQTRRRDKPALKVLAALEDMLQSGSWYHRAWAARCLGESGRGHLAIPSLRKALDDQVSEVCIAAIEALGVAGASDKETIAKLGKIVNYEGIGANDSDVMEAAFLLLGKIGPPAKEVFLEQRWLVRLLFDEKLHYYPRQKEMIRATVRVKPDRIPQILVRLVARLMQEDHGVPEAIAMLGADARKAIPEMMDVYRKSKSSAFRRKILAALAVLGPEKKETIPQLIKNVRTNPEDAAFLGAFGKLSKEAVPELLQGLKVHAVKFERGYSFIQQQWQGASYVDALGAIGPDARAAVPELLKLHEQWRKEPFVYLRIAGALKKIDPDAARKAGIP